MKTKRRYVALVLAVAAQVLPALAWAGPLSVVRNNDVSYISGGAGNDEQKQLEAMADNFNLKITMSLSDGDFVGGANVRISDPQGKTVLEAVADGPILLASLKPGAYTVAATLNGKKLEKPAQVGAGRQEVTFAWGSE